MADIALFTEWQATPHRFLWHELTRTAVLSDLHLGSGATLAATGIGVVGDFSEALLDAWGMMLKRGPLRVIVAGDLFDRPAPGERAVQQANEMFAQLQRECELIVTPGNHDPAEMGTMLTRPCEVVDAVKVGGSWVFHGHELPEVVERGGAGVRGWICGHQHPAVTISTRVQSAKMACYAVCDVKLGRGLKLVLLPAFSRAPLGSNLLTGRHWLMPVERPGDEAIRIAGLVEPASGEAQVLDFGPLSLLSTT